MKENRIPAVEDLDSDGMELHSEEENESDVIESNDEEETKDSNSDADEEETNDSNSDADGEETNDSKSDADEEETKDSSSDADEEEDEDADEEEDEDAGSSGDESNKDFDAGDGENIEELGANAGWADSMARILKTNKAKGKTSLVLSKAKKLTDLKVKVKKEIEAGFEVESKDGKIKREMIVESDSDESEEPVRKKRRDLPSARVKPNILEKDRERLLLKIATKGVVQLFNAVKKQQKDIDYKLSEAGPVDAKREKVLKNLDKNEFLNVLKGDSTLNTTIVETKEEKLLKEEKKSAKVTWNVLRDDFMMDAQMKDWDKSLVEEEEEGEESDIEME